jgi:hypothetical protein
MVAPKHPVADGDEVMEQTGRSEEQDDKQKR